MTIQQFINVMLLSHPSSGARALASRVVMPPGLGGWRLNRGAVLIYSMCRLILVPKDQGLLDFDLRTTTPALQCLAKSFLFPVSTSSSLFMRCVKVNKRNNADGSFTFLPIVGQGSWIIGGERRGMGADGNVFSSVDTLNRIGTL